MPTSSIFVGERQFQPVLHQMFLMGAGAADHALGGLALLDGAAVGGDPVVVLVAPIEVFNREPGDFPVIDFAEPGARQPDAAVRLVGLTSTRLMPERTRGIWAGLISARHGMVRPPDF